MSRGEQTASLRHRLPPRLENSFSELRVREIEIGGTNSLVGTKRFVLIIGIHTFVLANLYPLETP
jgi:hypothetical protein